MAYINADIEVDIDTGAMRRKEKKIVRYGVQIVHRKGDKITHQNTEGVCETLDGAFAELKKLIEAAVKREG